jgi:hypothetical protein
MQQKTFHPLDLYTEELLFHVPHLHNTDMQFSDYFAEQQQKKKSEEKQKVIALLYNIKTSIWS